MNLYIIYMPINCMSEALDAILHHPQGAEAGPPPPLFQAYADTCRQKQIKCIKSIIIYMDATSDGYQCMRCHKGTIRRFFKEEFSARAGRTIRTEWDECSACGARDNV